jgi:hypothetical protein
MRDGDVENEPRERREQAAFPSGLRRRTDDGGLRNGYCVLCSSRSSLMLTAFESTMILA